MSTETYAKKAPMVNGPWGCILLSYKVYLKDELVSETGDSGNSFENCCVNTEGFVDVFIN